MILDGFLRHLKMPEEEQHEERRQIFYDQNEKQFTILTVPVGANQSSIAVPVDGTNSTKASAALGTTQDRGRATSGAGGTKKLCHGSNFKWKSARNNGKAVKSIYSVLVNGGAVVVALVLTYIGLPPAQLLKTWTLAIALFIISDPFEFVTRTLSLQSRIIIATCMFLTVIAFSLVDIQFRKITLLIDALGILIVLGANVGWLSAENWHMSKAIERALQWDPECKSGKTWLSHGRRETKTLLHEIGYSLPEYELDFLARAIYMLGFVHGYTKTNKAKQRLENANRKIDAANKRAKDAESWVGIYKNRAESASDWKAKYEAECELRAEAEWQARNAAAQYKKLKMEYDALVAIDAEEETTQEAEQSPDESRSQYAARLYKELGSFQKVGDAMGVSKTQARRLVTQVAQESKATAEDSE